MCTIKWCKVDARSCVINAKRGHANPDKYQPIPPRKQGEQSASDVFEQPGRHFSTREKLVEALKQALLGHLASNNERTTILIKGSRSSRMELLVDELNNKKGEQSC